MVTPHSEIFGFANTHTAEDTNSTPALCERSHEGSEGKCSPYNMATTETRTTNKFLYAGTGTRVHFNSYNTKVKLMLLPLIAQSSPIFSHVHTQRLLTVGFSVLSQ